MIWQSKLEFVPGKPFQTDILVAGKGQEPTKMSPCKCFW